MSDSPIEHMADMIHVQRQYLFALATQARIDARTLQLIEEAATECPDGPSWRVWNAAHDAAEAANEAEPSSSDWASASLRAALTAARRIATGEADADTTTRGT